MSRHSRINGEDEFSGTRSPGMGQDGACPVDLQVVLSSVSNQLSRAVILLFRGMHTVGSAVGSRLAGDEAREGLRPLPFRRSEKGRLSTAKLSWLPRERNNQDLTFAKSSKLIACIPVVVQLSFGR